MVDRDPEDIHQKAAVLVNQTTRQITTFMMSLVTMKTWSTRTKSSQTSTSTELKMLFTFQ